MRLLILPLILLYSITSAQVTDSVNIQSVSDSLMMEVEMDSLTLIPVPDTVTTIGVGDIMMGTNYPEDRLPPDGGHFLMKGVEHILRDADMTFGNLEGVLLDSGGTPKQCKDPKVCYAFRSPVKYVE